MSARKKAEKRDGHEEREKERKRRFGVNAIISLMMKREREKERKRRFGVNAIISLMMTDDGIDAETSLSFFLSLSSCPSLFSAFFLTLTIGSINIFLKFDEG